MAVYKATMHFEGEFIPPSGFSESWEFERADDAEASSVALSMVGQRRQALSNNWSIRAVRLARLLPTGAGPTCRLRQEAVAIEGCIADSQGLLGATDTPWTAIYVEMPTRQSTPSVGLPPRPRRYQMRGVPDSWWDGATQALSAEVGPAVGAWLGWVVNTLQAGDAKANPGCTSARIQRYSGHCIRRISSRRIGRPFGLLRGRRSAAAPVVPPPS